MKQLQALPLKDSYWRTVEAEIQRIFYEAIYKPLFALFDEFPQEMKNSNDDPLSEALKRGTVWFEDGLFKGSFNAAITRQLKKIGAHYNRVSKTWGIESATLPSQYRIAIADAQVKFTNKREQIYSVLGNINDDAIAKVSQIPDTYLKTIDSMNADFMKTIRGSIGVAPQLTEAQRGIIASEWGYNLNLYIKGWASENIPKLRQQIQENTFSGKRSSALLEVIKKNYGVSQRKARFLARQETSLLMSKFRETRYKDVGVSRYRWSTSHDERVRKDHKELNGKIFTWDNPPVSNRETGKRSNPGEDFGCRCVAIPLLD